MDKIYLASEFSLKDWILIAVIILLLFGANRIPQMMRGLGKGISEFKKGMKEGEKSDSDGENKPDEKKSEPPPK